LLRRETIDRGTHGRETEQRRSYLLDRVVHRRTLEALELHVVHLAVGVGPEVEDAVDLVQVLGIVHYDLVLGVVTEHRAPEPHLRLEGGGARERVTGGARVGGEGENDQLQKNTNPSHLRRPQHSNIGKNYRSHKRG